MREPLEHYITAGLPDAFLLITCGLPGTGKSALSHLVHRLKGAFIISSDTLRRQVIKGDIFDPAIAADAGNRLAVYDVLFRKADEALSSHEGVILDATFFTQALRRRAADIAVHHARPFFIAETTCPEQVALERILGRDRSTSTSNALTEEAYRSNRQSFEPVDVTALKRELPRLSITRFTVDTSLPPFSWYVVGEEIRD